MYYWTPQRVKELNEKGYKLKFYNSKELQQIENNQESADTQDKESCVRHKE